MTTPMAPRKRILQLEVLTEAQAAELETTWQQILTGQRTQLTTAAENLNEIMERARTGLQTIVRAIEKHPGTGQTGRLVRFLAGVYNGSDFPFDLTDLRALDTELANACIDYLNYDRLAKAEVHTHLPHGGLQMQRLISDHGLHPQPRLSSHEKHEPRLYALSERLNREPDELLNEALGELLSRYEAKTFGGLLATQTSPDDGRPLLHARRLSASGEKPLCGANDGPWTGRAFDFKRLSCRECQAIVLNR
jgi:hypothetical protein